jgi:hypothetical protein
MRKINIGAPFYSPPHGKKPTADGSGGTEF